MWHILQGDFGRSFRTGQTVWQAVSERIPVSFELMILAELIGLAIGVPLAIACAAKAGSAFDRFMTGSAFGMLSVPTFLSAILLIYLFAVELRILPATGYVPFTEDPVANLRFMVLPALTLGLAEWPGIMRVLRSDMIAALQEDYIALAKAKGLKPSRILFVHALKPSSLTLVTITGINIGRLIGGTVIVEIDLRLAGDRPSAGRRDLHPRPHHPAGRGAAGRRGLRDHEFHRRHAVRPARPEDPPWPRLSSASRTRPARHRPGAAAKLGLLFWFAIGWMVLVFAVAIFADLLPLPSPTDMDMLERGGRSPPSTGSAPTGSAVTSCRG